MEEKKLEATLDAILDKLGALDNRLASVEQGQKEMRADMSSMRTDIKDLQQGQVHIRKDLSGMRADLSQTLSCVLDIHEKAIDELQRKAQ